MCLKMGDSRKYPYQLYHGWLPYFNPPPPLLPLPSEFPNGIILPYPQNSVVKIDTPPPPLLFASILSSNPSELLAIHSGNSGMKIRSFLFATFQQMQPTLPLNCPELVQNIKELRILNGVLGQKTMFCNELTKQFYAVFTREKRIFFLH